MTEQCTAQITKYAPFTMGGPVNQTSQCENDAAHIVTEKSSDETMPVCARCLTKFWKLNEGDEALYSVTDT